MCKFCYRLGENDKKEINWATRSTYADDTLDGVYGRLNSHEGVTSDGFKITAYKYDNSVMVGVEYRLETNEGLIISPFSETIQWSYCPFCGQRLGESEPKFADEMYQHQFDIEDDEYENEKAIKDFLYGDENLVL